MAARTVFAVLLLAVGGWFHSKAWQSFTSLGRIRSAQEVPIAALRAGPARLHGKVLPGPNGLLRSHYFQADCLYYEYRKTEEYRDSDGDRRTRTLESEDGAVSFLLNDGHGLVLVELPQASYVDVQRKQSTVEGNLTWYENRLESDDEVWVYGEIIGDFSALEGDTPPQLIPGPDGILRLSSEGGGRLLGIDQLWFMLWGIFAAVFCSAGAGLGLPSVYRRLRR